MRALKTGLISLIATFLIVEGLYIIHDGEALFARAGYALFVGFLAGFLAGIIELLFTGDVDPEG